MSGESAQSLRRFFEVETASTLVLALTTAVAVLWANSSSAQAYASAWQTPLPLQLGRWLPAHSIQYWIDDGLMTLFFLLVGLEIRSELHDGVLSDRKIAVLPVVAAVGGILFPALVFIGFNADPVLRRGWPVPTATDIAFAVGVLTSLGRRVPRTLRILLLTLAIVDDIGAVLIIAVYYSQGFVASGLLLCGGAIGLVCLFRWWGLQGARWYLLPGTLLWYGLGQAGVHPSLAGVILGLLTPVENQSVGGESPVDRLKDALHPWVAFGIMPLFALANAGVGFRGITATAGSTWSIGLGVMLGLVFGKPIGIGLTTAVCIRAGVCAAPPGIRWPHLLVLGCLGGVGFTMAIFLADLAFARTQLLAMAKGAVLLGSVVAAGLGLVLGRLLLPATD